MIELASFTLVVEFRSLQVSQDGSLLFLNKILFPIFINDFVYMFKLKSER